jgi:hypothetical protein
LVGRRVGGSLLVLVLVVVVVALAAALPVFLAPVVMMAVAKTPIESLPRSMVLPIS